MAASFAQLRAAKQSKEQLSYVNSASTVSATDPTAAATPSFDSEGLYPSLPEDIQIRTSDALGRGLWLRKATQPGSILISLKPHIAVLSTRSLRSHCSACFGAGDSLKRCTQCHSVYYCDSACQSKDWGSHKNECTALQRWAENPPSVDLPIPSDGIRCLGRLLWKKQKQGSANMWSKEVDAMQSHRPQASSAAVELQTYLAHSLVRFLGVTSPTDLAEFGILSAGELVAFISRFTTNSFTVTDPTLTPIGVAISPIVALINHSCDPNAVVVFPRASPNKAQEPAMQVIALKDIPAGSEIRTAYIDTSLPRALRQKSLSETYNFTCGCNLCTTEAATDPRVSMACPKSCGGLCPIPTEDLDIPRCNKCNAATKSPEAVLDAVRLGQEALEKATSIQFKDPAKAKQLTTNLIKLLHSAGVSPSSHPLLALSRLQHTLLISTLSENLTQDALDETVRAIHRSVIGCSAVFCDGHPVRGIALAELAKTLSVDEPAPKQSPSIQFPPSGPARLKLACDTLIRAHHELLIGFGRENGGGQVGRDVRDMLVAVEKELGVWKQGIKNTIADQPVPLKVAFYRLKRHSASRWGHPVARHYLSCCAPLLILSQVYSQTQGLPMTDINLGSGFINSCCAIRNSRLSCAECRRSRVKCNRVFPCQSCVRRGCAAICPEGTMKATKGKQALSAHTTRLSQQVKQLSERVAYLESALSENKDEVIYRPELVPSAQRSNAVEAQLDSITTSLGSLSIKPGGQSKYHGETATSECLQELFHVKDRSSSVKKPENLGFTGEILELTSAFPFGIEIGSHSKSILLPYIPAETDALELVDLYYQHSTWLYNPIIRVDFMISIMQPLYGSIGSINLEAVSSHKLSIFFILLALGASHVRRPDSSYLVDYFRTLSRAALSIDPIYRFTSCATVQALFIHVLLLHDLVRGSTEERWLLLGITMRLSQIIGLQRDPERWNLGHEEVQRRRVLFWELYVFSALNSLFIGRPPAFILPHTDCRFPNDTEPRPFTVTSGRTELSWHAWKCRYASSGLWPSTEYIFEVGNSSYDVLLAIDRQIRRFAVPEYLQAPVSRDDHAWSSDIIRAKQQYLVLCIRECNLLYIHRSHFMQAIRQTSEEPLGHKFGPSVLAVYRSSCRIISGLISLYEMLAEEASNSWCFWSSFYSACIVLGTLALDSPGCRLAENALHELDRALSFYKKGGEKLVPPATLSVLQSLRDRAEEKHSSFRVGAPCSPTDATGNVKQLINSELELEVLGGCPALVFNPSDGE